MHIKKKRGARILALSLNANFCSWHKAEKKFNENLKQYFVRENHQTKFTTKELSLFLSDGHGAALREARRTRSAQTQQRGLTLGNLKRQKNASTDKLIARNAPHSAVASRQPEAHLKK
jgi:hypothetical protein